MSRKGGRGRVMPVRCCTPFPPLRLHPTKKSNQFQPRHCVFVCLFVLLVSIISVFLQPLLEFTQHTDRHTDAPRYPPFLRACTPLLLLHSLMFLFIHLKSKGYLTPCSFCHGPAGRPGGSHFAKCSNGTLTCDAVMRDWSRRAVRSEEETLAGAPR